MKTIFAPTAQRSKAVIAYLLLAILLTSSAGLLTACESTPAALEDPLIPSTPLSAGKLGALPTERSDYITQEDVAKAPEGYRLYVEGVGDVFVKEIRPPEGSNKACRVDKRSLIEQIRLQPPGTLKHTWLALNYIKVPEELGLGDYFCIGLGVGCYILVSNS